VSWRVKKEKKLMKCKTEHGEKKMRILSKNSAVLGMILILAWAGAGTAAAEGINALERLQEPLNVLRGKVISYFQAEKQKVSDEMERFTKTLQTDLERFAGLLEEAGFELASIGVSAALFPEVTLCAAVTRILTPEEEAAFRAKRLEKVEGGVIGEIEHRILQGLLDIDETVPAIRLEGYQLGGVEIEVGLDPGMKAIFLPAGENGCG
jgi:hypothetical protein